MAQTCSYVLDWFVPVANCQKKSTETDIGCIAKITVTGPATSVGAGMTIAGLSTDFTTISAAEVCNVQAHDVTFMIQPGTSNAVASLKVHASRPATGLQLSNAVNLSSTSFDAIVYGTGPLASSLSF